MGTTDDGAVPLGFHPIPTASERVNLAVSFGVTSPVLLPVAPAFRVIATSFVPELTTAPEAVWTAVFATIEGALRDRPPALRRQLVTFIRLVGLVGRLRFGRPLPRLDAAERLRLLRGFERSRLALMRRGIWGLRTLVFMGYYTQPAVIDSLGYRATPAGWDR